MEWANVKDVFYAALDHPPADRPRFLHTACQGSAELRREVESLLAAYDEAPEFLDQPALGADVASTLLSRGARIGPYRIIEEIGAGGMGAVYLAVRDDGLFQHQVAIKLVRHGPNSDFLLRRFHYERQILAFLNHPFIARILDGGNTPSGHPYFVMEYVTGRPVVEYCEAQSLDLRARLTLFRQICEAVAYAHQNLIVHCDLKPANILVTPEGSPKLLDFGVARLILPDNLDAELATTKTVGNRMLTPGYASPEQVRGLPTTTASDVYSLGAVLYEILSGRKAHRLTSGSFDEMSRVICEEPPVKPSLAAAESPTPNIVPPAALRGDLDRIVLKAMHKEPARRYSSVEHFSEDVGRFLAGRPVEAQDDSLAYRASKFVRRNKAAVAAAAFALLSLVAGMIGTLWQARTARLQKERAERRFQDVRRLATSFLVDNETLAALPGGTAVRERMIQRALAYLDDLAREATGDAGLQRELALAYEKMGDVQGRADGPNVGDTAGALASYTKALAIRQSLASVNPSDPATRRELALTMTRLSGAQKVAGNYTAGLELDRRALNIREALRQEQPANRDYQREVAASYTAMGGSLSHFGDWNGVLETRAKALALHIELVKSPQATANDWRGLALAHNRMASIRNFRKEADLATQAYRAGLEAAREGGRRFPSEFLLRLQEANALTGLGELELNAAHEEAGFQLLREAEAIYAAQLEADPRDARARSLLASSHHRIGRALTRFGKPAPALVELRRALDLRETLAAANPSNAGAQAEVAETLAALGDTHAAARSRDKAIDAYRRARAILLDLARQGKANSTMTTVLKRVETGLAGLQGS